MMAAIAAAERGAQVTLMRAQRAAGKKTEYHGKGPLQRHQQLYGRRRFCQMSPVMENSFTVSFSAFNGQDAMAFFEEPGCPLENGAGQPGLSPV